MSAGLPLQKLDSKRHSKTETHYMHWCSKNILLAVYPAVSILGLPSCCVALQKVALCTSCWHTETLCRVLTLLMMQSTSVFASQSGTSDLGFICECLPFNHEICCIIVATSCKTQMRLRCQAKNASESQTLTSSRVKQGRSCKDACLVDIQGL